jgi:hypothetical protein
VTIRGGQTLFGEYGGGIHNDEGSTLTLNNSVVRDNQIHSRAGAGIANLVRATAETNNSSIVHNDAIPPGAIGGTGGGIYNEGTLTVANSTISSNKAFDGGAIQNLNLSSDTPSTITIRNSTILSNTALAVGGGLHVSPVGVPGATINLQNSIIARNTDDAGSPDCFGSYTSKGYNLVGNSEGCTINQAQGDRIGTSSTPIDPKLSPLQNNGGLTWVHLPLHGSPAIDAIPLGQENCLPPSYDQHNGARPLDGDGSLAHDCDIGAIEVETGLKAALFVVGDPSLGPGDDAVKTRLEGLGYTLIIEEDDSAVATDGIDKTLVVISSTVPSSAVDSKFKSVATPVVTWENALFDDLGMTKYKQVKILA